MLALALAVHALAADPPPDLAKRVAAREAASEAARAHYTYQQSLSVEEFDGRGKRLGEYQENREVIFSPVGERTERVVGRPLTTLQRLRLTDEDFQDLRDVQPLLLTPERLFLYETRYKGEETIDGQTCWVLQVRPRQLLQGQRLFAGLLWIDQTDYAVVRSEGRAEPPVYTTIRGVRSENLFPHFTTVRAKIDGTHWFPIHTYADDTLNFRTGPQRMRLVVRYRKYQRFGADSSVTFTPGQP